LTVTAVNNLQIEAPDRVP